MISMHKKDASDNMEYDTEKSTDIRNGEDISADGFVPRSNLCSVAYVRYLEFKQKKIRQTMVELYGTVMEDVSEVLLREAFSCQQKIREMERSAFLFRAYDLYAAGEMEKLQKYTDESSCRYVEMIFSDTDRMPENIKEIYVDFNQSYHVTEYKK